MRQFLWVGVVLLVAGVGRLGAAELHEGWAVLSEASTDGYYRDRVHSSAANFQAIARLPELVKSGRPRQKELAEGLIEVIGKKQVADAAAVKARGQLKSDEKKAQFDVLIGGIAATAKDAEANAGRMLGGKNTPPPADTGSSGDVTGLYLNAMLGLGASASRAAAAGTAAAQQRVKVREYWESKLFPAARNLKTGEWKAAPLEIEVTADGGDRQVWSAVKNVSGKALSNVTLILKPKDGAKDLPTQYYFVRDWPTAVVIRPDPFRRWILTPGEPDDAPPKELSATLEVWSDQGHAAPRDAKPVGFYEHRARFVDTLVREGARYGAAVGAELVVVEFPRVAKGGDGKVVEATVTRTKGGKGEPQVTRFRGPWVTVRGDDADSDAVVGLKLTLTQLDAPPAKADANPRRNAPKTPPQFPSLTFQWDRPAYLVGLPSGEKFAVQPLPDAPTAKK